MSVSSRDLADQLIDSVSRSLIAEFRDIHFRRGLVIGLLIGYVRDVEFEVNEEMTNKAAESAGRELFVTARLGRKEMSFCIPYLGMILQDLVRDVALSQVPRIRGYMLDAGHLSHVSSQG